MVVKRALLSIAIACLVACAPAKSPLQGNVPVIASGKGPSLDELTKGAPLTVVVFFSYHCPCMRAHDGRLRALAAKYAPRGVRFVLVDAEVDADPARDAAEAKQRGYTFPILANPSGSLADAFGAEYATYTAVLDGAQRVRYLGGLDSDKQDMNDDAQLFVRDALEDLLAGKSPAVPVGKALGCVLRR